MTDTTTPTTKPNALKALIAVLESIDDTLARLADQFEHVCGTDQGFAGKEFGFIRTSSGE